MNKVVKSTFLNLIGNVVYYFCQWLISILIVRITGSYEDAGIYSLGCSVCNIFLYISTFGVRTYQIADVDNNFSNNEYITLRIITSSAALLLLPVYLLIMRYSTYICGVFMCLMLFKTVESFVDVLHGIFQKNWRLDIVCKSFLFRGIFGLAAFWAAEILWKNLVISITLMAVASLISALLVDFKSARSMIEINPDFKNKRILKLVLACMPLFLHAIFLNTIPAIPKIYAQKLLGEELLGFYSSVATPVVIVQLASSNIITILVPLMTRQFKDKNKGFYKTIAKVFLIIAAIGICAVAGFELLGNWLLAKLFGDEILEYSYLLIPAVILSALTVMSWLAATLFTVADMNKTLVITDVCAGVLTVVLSVILININGLQGINLSLIFAYAAYIIAGLIIVLKHTNNYFKGEKK